VTQWDYTVDSMPDSTFKIADTDDADLGNFFSRPLKINSFAWGTNTTFFEKFNPWEDFFENPRVMNRIANFNLLRCKLKVRFVINGNSFHYGRVIASYLPLAEDDNFTQDRAFFPADITAASQRPHVYLDPTTSQGGSLTLPFVFYGNALSIPNQDWRRMGKIIMHSMESLKHANGASDQVVMSVFAWAEDVSLSIPTSNEPDALSPQMGEIFAPQAKDEYGTGPISRPAATIAKVAGKLSNVPGIGMYAKATEMAAGAMSGIASLFGYSRPISLAEIQPYKPTIVGNMCNTNVPDTSQKLTLDVKQETTVDPRAMGLGGVDEMTIKSIAQRESYLTKFGWKVSDSAESLLWNTEVSPVLWSELGGATANEIHMPACCFATLPFGRWRGTVKFRFQIVASSFHKGRLKISYDPSYPVSNEYNINYTSIIDLAKERDFTVGVGWGQEFSYINHRCPGVDSIPYGITPISAAPHFLANGILSVHVVNDLTVPNSATNNDIEINVFVSVGEDFEVADPDARCIENLTWFRPQGTGSRSRDTFAPQMAEVTAGTQPDTDLTQNEDEPMKMVATQLLAPSLSDTDQTSNVFFGDPVTSFRQCLKRYNYHSAISPTRLGVSMLDVVNADFPYYRGYAAGAIHKANLPTPGTPYNYCKMTLINYLTPAFTCRRGGMRWKYFRTGGSSQDPDTSLMMVSRTASALEYSQTDTGVITPAEGSQSERVRQAGILIPHTWDGAVVTSTAQNPVIEAELPWYVIARFFPAKDSGITTPSPPWGFTHFHRLSTIWKTTENDSPLIHCFVSVAEDFNLAFFTGAPIAFYVPQADDPPAEEEP